MRILVCGSRTWDDRDIVATILAGFYDECAMVEDDLTIIEGCAKGADSYACHWYDGCDRHASRDRVLHEHFPADWEKYGKAAGPIRNRQMLDNGKPDLVIAFSDDLAQSRGTKNMVEQAKKGAKPVYLVSRP